MDSQPPVSPLVHLAAPAGRPLSGLQQEFNRLARRIAQLEQETATLRVVGTELRQRVQAEYRPLQAQHNAQRAALVQVLDAAYQHHKLTASERAKVADLLGRTCTDLPQKGFPELQPLLAKYAPAPLSAVEAAAHTQAAAAQLQAHFRTQYGIEFDPAADLSTPEQVQAYVRAQWQRAQAATEATAQARAARRAKRQQAPKRQVAAQQQQQQVQQSTKAVRTLYLDLVKHLHPDRESDPAEQARKTRLLQHVTTAYQAGELLTLLRLQLELERLDPAHLENLAETQLRYYNTLLRGQAQELSQVLRDEQQRLAAFMGRPGAPASDLQASYEQQKKQLQARTQQLAAEVQAMQHSPAALKAWLKAQTAA